MMAFRIDPSGEFTRERSWWFNRYATSENKIKEQLHFVAKESESRRGKLLGASDSHAGLEILHLFVVDVLGRETPAAKIFKSKSEEE